MKKRTKWIAIYLLLVAAVAVISYSLAAYTSLSSAKRVITVRGSEQYFTSDILVQYDTNKENELQSRVKSFGKNDKTRTFDVTVSNHLQSDSTAYDKKDIDYTFKAELVDVNGKAVQDSSMQTAWTVNGIAPTNGVYTASGKFTGGSARDCTYKFTLTGDDILQYRIKITATPINRTEYKPLGRLILLTTDSTVTKWTGSFLTTEQSASNNQKALNVINYRISGHLEEDCVLSWDSSKVEIDQWFLDQMGIKEGEITTDNNKIKSVKLHLGAAGTPQQYTIQFYRTYAVGDLSPTEDWNKITGYIQFTNSSSNSNSNSEGD